MGSRIHFAALASCVGLVLSACGSSPTIQTARIEFKSGTARVSTLAAAPAPPPAQASVDPHQAPAALPPPSLAVIIGVDHAKGSPTLQGAVRDATTLRDALVAYGWPRDKIQVLTDNEATTEAILAAIHRLAQAPVDSRAVFAFAGHTRRIRGENHIVTADGRQLSAGRLAEALGQVRAPLWVALPTCYAAGFALPGIVAEGRIATFASQANEIAYEGVHFGRSYLFQHMIAEAMLDRKAPGSVEQSFAYAVEALRDDKRSTPVLDDRYPGEFVLGTLPPKPPPPPSGPAAGETAEPSGPDTDNGGGSGGGTVVRACAGPVRLGACDRNG